MRVPPLLAAAFALSPFAHAQSAERMIVEHDSASESIALGPVLVDDFHRFEFFSDSFLRSFAARRPQFPEIELRSVHVMGQSDLRLSGEVVGLDAAGTDIRSSFNFGDYACGGNCRWGPFDQRFNTWPLMVDTGVALGETRSFDVVMRLPLIWDVAYTEASHPLAWSEILYDGEFSALSRLAYVNAFPIDPTGAPTDMLFTSLVGHTAVESAVEATFQLHATPATEYCTSPANSTGSSGSLAAFGAPVAGDDWLTIRATDLPVGSASILFVGTEPGDTPLATATVCVGGVVRRTGGVQVATSGTVEFELDLAGFAPGDVAHVQVFHRDPILGLAATSASSVALR